MRMVSWGCARMYESIYNGSSCVFFNPGRIFIAPTPIQTNYCSQPSKTSGDEKGKKYSKVKKNEYERSEPLNEAEIQTEQSNTKSAKWKESKATSQNADLVENEIPVKKPKKTEPKNFRIKTSITEFDLQIKIKQMLHLLEKGRNVSCLLTAEKGKPSDNIINLLNNSKLKDYFVSYNREKTQIFFKKEAPGKVKEAQNKENKDSS